MSEPTTSAKVGSIFRDITGTKSAKPEGKASDAAPDADDPDVTAAALPQPASRQAKAEAAAKKAAAKKKTAKKAAAKKAAAKKTAKKK